MSARHQICQQLPPARPVREIVVGEKGFSADDVIPLSEPVILRGLVAHWPAVRAAKSSREDLLAYLSRFGHDAVVPVSVGPASIAGRVFYNADFSGMNVERGTARFGEVLRRVYKHGAAEPPPLIYMASIDVDEHLSGFRHENDVDFGPFKPLPSIWIGTRTRIAAHNDLPLNLACVVAGRRTFTLFPPDQTPNLYVGPFELTPAGRPISMVDLAAPDLERFPRFAA
ncbi:MAG: cupin-like domain-containing protein, partial [Alphaproteobacteria bacterium]